MTNIGKAYGFFNPEGTQDKIRVAIIGIKGDFDRYRVAPELEVSLSRSDEVRGDSKLVDLAREAGESGISHALSASFEGQSNYKTARELADLYNHLYSDCLVSGSAEAQIFYEEGGSYRRLE